MPENLCLLQLFDLVLDLALRGVELPGIDADRESVLLVHYDLSLHDKAAAEQDVEDIGRGADLVHSLVHAILLLAEVAVQRVQRLR